MSTAASSTQSAIRQILDLARWAPSGDNTQPWGFRLVDDTHVAVEGFDTRDWCVYDFDGHASHMAHGALLETIRIAATAFDLAAHWTLRSGCPESAPIYDVAFVAEPGLAPDALFPFIQRRVVQRRAMQTTSLDDKQRLALTASVGSGYRLQFFESFAGRLRVAKLLWDNAKIRLTCPEAYDVHRKTIEWGARFSKDRIPAEAVGVDAATERLMEWVMQSWKRVDFFNRYLLGTVAPRLQLDLRPALACAAHILVRPMLPLVRLEDYVRAGSAMQRLWLTTTALGLHLQPQMTPIIFRWYSKAGRPVSALPEVSSRVARLAEAFEALAAAESDDSFAFFCRIGRATEPKSRSLRRELDELLIQG